MNVLENVKSWWNGAGPLLKATAAAAAALVAATAAWIAFDGGDGTDFSPVFTRLSQQDAAEILAALRQKKVPYKLDDDGGTILVPRARVHEARLDLAGAGLPRGGGVGFEIFDKGAQFMTEFTQRVNFARAIQGELARTISHMPGVESARVHLALPENSLFRRDRREPSAAVYLKLHPGRVMTAAQIAGVTHLVATAVEGLSTERVAVLDSAGRLLGPPPDGAAGALNSRSFSAIHDHESLLEKRVVELIEPIVGAGRVVARVAADMDLSRVESKEERFDPDGAAVRSERKAVESAAAREIDAATAAAGGVAGTAGNLPQGAAAQQAAGQTSGSSQSRVTSQVEYAVPSVVRSVVTPLGGVKRLSVAVLVDSGPGAPGGEKSGAQPKPPPVDNLRELVKKAVGFDASRGDQIEVMAVPFAREDSTAGLPVPDAKPGAMPRWLLPAGAAFAAVVAAFVLALAVSRRKKRGPVAAAVRRPAEIEARNEPGMSERPADPVVVLREEVRQLARGNPQATVEVVKTWLSAEPAKGGGSS